MRLRVDVSGDLKGFAAAKEAGIRRGATIAARRIATRAKLALRQDVRRAGLGPRLANTWQDRVYPQQQESLRPSAFVWSKAGELISAHTEGATIRAANGVYLAVPTKNVPRRRNRLATPAEVLALYGVETFNIVRGRGGNLLLMVPAVRSRKGNSWRRASSIRTGRQGRKAEMVLMFVLVRQVTLRKRLDWPRIADEIGREWPAILGQEVAREMDAA